MKPSSNHKINMRVLLITVGSRGDAEPFCALAQALADAGHDVDLWLQQDNTKLAPTYFTTIHVHTLPFTCDDFYKFVGNPKPEHEHANPRVKFTGVIADICGELVLPCTSQVLEACETAPPSVIIASSLARHLAMAASAKLQVPLCLVQLQPLIPTQDFPHCSNVDECVAAIMGETSPNRDNYEYYLELERFQYKFMQDKWQAVYEELNIPFPAMDEMEAILVGKNDDIVMVNAYSNQLTPDYSGCGDNVWNVGPLADDYLPKDYTLLPELVDFLYSQDDKPICIGFGSMPFQETQVIVEALKETNERAVLVGSAMMNIDLGDQVLAIESVPYSYLLPQCSMMLSHGGAGVVCATLRAGIPTIISPLLGDQFFHAKLLQAKRLGVAAESLPELTVDTLVESIARAKSCTEECVKVGMAIRNQESGAKRMVRLLEARFGP